MLSVSRRGVHPCCCCCCRGWKIPALNFPHLESLIRCWPSPWHPPSCPPMGTLRMLPEPASWKCALWPVPSCFAFWPQNDNFGRRHISEKSVPRNEGVRYLLEKLGSLLESGHSCFSTFLGRVSFTHNWVASFVLSKTQNIILSRNNCTSFPKYFVYTESIGKYDENRAKAFSCPPYVHFSKLIHIKFLFPYLCHHFCHSSYVN